MELYVVIDTRGEGRVLGVFDDRVTAETFVAEDPCYYQLHPCRLNEVNPEVLGWAENSTRRTALEHIMTLVARRCAG